MTRIAMFVAALSFAFAGQGAQAQAPDPALPVEGSAQPSVAPAETTGAAEPVAAPEAASPSAQPPAQATASSATQLSRPPAPSTEPGELPKEPIKPGGPSTGARIELTVLSAPIGASMGLFFCFAATCEGDARSVAGALLGGAAAGVLVSGLVTRFKPIAPSTAQAIEGGTLWGSLTSLYVWLLASDRDGDSRGLFAGMAAGGLLGAGLGGVIERQLLPTSGAVALANSSAFWLSAMTMLTVVGIGPDFDDDAPTRGLAGGLLAAQALGLGIGGAIGQRFGATRSQVWLSDMGAVLLGGTMPLLTWLIGGDAVPAEAMLATTAVGMGLGFATAYLLSEFLPRRRAEKAARRAAGLFEHTSLALLPMRQGGGLSLSARLR
jgi:hypothetical protein